MPREGGAWGADVSGEVERREVVVYLLVQLLTPVSSRRRTFSFLELCIV